MKLTIITGPRGKLVAIVHAHISEHDRSASTTGVHATLRPGPGQTFHEIEVPGEYEGRPSHELRAWGLKNLPSRRKKAKKRK
jgi:hypothetical protein